MKSPKLLKACMEYTAGELKRSENPEVLQGVAKLPDNCPVFCNPDDAGFLPGKSMEVDVEPTDED